MTDRQVIVTYGNNVPYKTRKDRQVFFYKKENIEFSGTYYEAQEYFRTNYPSKSIIFQQNLKTFG